MKCLRFAILAGILISSLACAQAPAGQATPSFEMETAQHVLPSRAAATRALALFVAQLAQTRSLPPQFPLAVNSARALRLAHIGWGFQVYDVSPARLEAGASLSRAAASTGEWRYAVVLHGRPVGLITMVDTPHGWQMVSVGGIGLSRQVGAVLVNYAGRRDMRLRYVRVPQAESDFIELKQGSQAARYLPLAAARASLHLTHLAGNVPEPMSASQLAPRLRTLVARAIAVKH